MLVHVSMALMPTLYQCSQRRQDNCRINLQSTAKKTNNNKPFRSSNSIVIIWSSHIGDDDINGIKTEIILTSDEHLDNSSISSAVRSLFLDSKSVWRFGRQDNEPGFNIPIALLDKFKVVKLVKNFRPSIFSSLLLWRYKFRSSLKCLI